MWLCVVGVAKRYKLWQCRRFAVTAERVSALQKVAKVQGDVAVLKGVWQSSRGCNIP